MQSAALPLRHTSFSETKSVVLVPIVTNEMQSRTPLVCFVEFNSTTTCKWRPFQWLISLHQYIPGLEIIRPEWCKILYIYTFFSPRLRRKLLNYLRRISQKLNLMSGDTLGDDSLFIHMDENNGQTLNLLRR